MGNGGALSPNRLKLTAPSVHGSCLVQVDDHHEDLLPRKSAIHPTGLSDVSMRIKGQRPRPPVGKPRGLSPGVTTKTQKSLLRGGLDTETTGYRGGNILMAQLGTHWITAEGGRRVARILAVRLMKIKAPGENLRGLLVHYTLTGGCIGKSRFSQPIRQAICAATTSSSS